jgi:predicted 3-demethylubiquinone-9 3-methyltransferase (glyoxalase superfamily)
MKDTNSYAIVPHLWFDRQAKEAALFYTGIFENSRLIGATVLEDTPSGDAESVHFELAGQPFEAISAGPEFQLNPSISLMVACATPEEVDAKWHALADGGVALMELGEYPFSRRYGWIQDRYGLSWQLMLVDDVPEQKITPSFFSLVRPAARLKRQ